ncbi:ABC transporter, phosphonate, periplasmic substrate-binding family protein [Yersinia rochesterensis]|nr:PhnD/SsuA/transferrin family substrate-binding protein [Yersinia rochesterensis]AIN17782.1 ABC transporter, phosphonate, periplasmic substrate-binding family protein [Yersinia rochesterensis]AJJ37011.1 ABC transporter, phosphonate, periplasmic substrate-binding family protein [Yersinia rochesterensis]CNG94880.1 ABC-type phosphate/phosphonate transport system%2Cperiplasmic component [Yersinia kristensenii]CRY59582.1 ABC-type phosphate/phosphonate transport system%2Cperiplasmic component [Yers
MISLPMYGVRPEQDVRPFWQLLSQQLRRHGVSGVSEQLLWPLDLLQHWRDPTLLLSQTCGFPLVTQLQQQVRLVGVFSYQSPYCSGEYYRSLVVVRDDEQGEQLSDFRHRTVVYNSTNSQSGYNALRVLIAPLAVNGRFFSRRVASGSHYRSIEMIQQRQADIAAIDCVSFALLQRDNPAAVAGLKIIAKTDVAPGLPLITSVTTSEKELIQIRQAIRATVNSPAATSAKAILLINGFSVLPWSAYNVIKQMQEKAAALGVITL